MNTKKNYLKYLERKYQFDKTNRSFKRLNNVKNLKKNRRRTTNFVKTFFFHRERKSILYMNSNGCTNNTLWIPFVSELYNPLICHTHFILTEYRVSSRTEVTVRFLSLHFGSLWQLDIITVFPRTWLGKSPNSRIMSGKWCVAGPRWGAGWVLVLELR